jgi:peptidoglycan/xylan/chitin deacetylase (PgdA/CDA1 family)
MMQNILSAVLYYSGLIKILSFLTRHDAKILLYHSVSDHESPFVKGIYIWVSSRTFRKHLSYLSRHYQIISLERLAYFLKQKRIPSYAAVITFDDGCSDNYYCAYPHLKQNRIPATVFLSLGSVDNKNPIWVYKLYYLINEFGVEKIASGIESLTGMIPGSMLQGSSNGKGGRKIEALLAYSMKKECRDELLSDLYRALGISQEKVFAENQIFLTWSQIEQMHRDGIEFGNHGESHTPFSVMPPDEQEKEIVESQEMLKKKLGAEAIAFAYPFGKSRDYSTATKEMVRRSGHSCIVTTQQTLNRCETSPYELGRIHIGEIPVYRLAFELQKSHLKHLLRRVGLLKADD